MSEVAFRKHCLELDGVCKAPGQHRPRKCGSLSPLEAVVAVTARGLETLITEQEGGTGGFHKSSRVRYESQDSGISKRE